jgi:hypothetical protein
VFDRENLPFLLACIALVLSFLLTIALHAGSDSSDVAAWVQALGSIAAVASAAWLVHHQHRLEQRRAERDRRERQRDAAKRISGLFAEALRVIRNCDDTLASGFWLYSPPINYRLAEINTLVEVLCALGRRDLPDLDGLDETDILLMTGCLTRAACVFRACLADVEVDRNTQLLRRSELCAPLTDAEAIATRWADAQSTSVTGSEL